MGHKPTSVLKLWLVKLTCLLDSSAVDLGKMQHPLIAAQQIENLTSFRDVYFFCLTNSHAFLGMYFRCFAESIPRDCSRHILIFPEGS